MKSPFPGMDPYLEKYWHEVHQSLITYTRDFLQANLPAPLRARIEQRVLLEVESDNWRAVYPDVHVVEFPHASLPAAVEAETAVAIEEEPLLITPQSEPLTEGYIEIVDAESGNRVITVIEFLSPTNKLPGRGREQYLFKQRDVIRAGANLVEIDLTRTGQRTLAVPDELVPPAYRTTYQICIWRSRLPSRFELYRIPLMRRLPPLSIPLRAKDTDARMALQMQLNRCYTNGRYDDLDYRAAPNPPLNAEEAALADEMLRAKGLR